MADLSGGSRRSATGKRQHMVDDAFAEGPGAQHHHSHIHLGLGATPADGSSSPDDEEEDRRARKRLKHNEDENKRRQKLNQQFKELAELVDCSKPHKAAVLTAAIARIQELSDQLAGMNGLGSANPDEGSGRHSSESSRSQGSSKEVVQQRHLLQQQQQLIDQQQQQLIQLQRECETLQSSTSKVAASLAKAEFENSLDHNLNFRNGCVAMIVSNLSGRIVDANGAFCELVRYPREALLSPQNSVFEITHPDSLATSFGLVSSLLGNHRVPHCIAKKYVASDGSVKCTKLISWMSRDSGGQPTFINTVIQVVSKEQMRDLEEAMALQHAQRDAARHSRSHQRHAHQIASSSSSSSNQMAGSASSSGSSNRRLPMLSPLAGWTSSASDDSSSPNSSAGRNRSSGSRSRHSHSSIGPRATPSPVPAKQEPHAAAHSSSSSVSASADVPMVPAEISAAVSVDGGGSGPGNSGSGSGGRLGSDFFRRVCRMSGDDTGSEAEGGAAGVLPPRLTPRAEQLGGEPPQASFQQMHLSGPYGFAAPHSTSGSGNPQPGGMPQQPGPGTPSAAGEGAGFGFQTIPQGSAGTCVAPQLGDPAVPPHSHHHNHHHGLHDSHPHHHHHHQEGGFGGVESMPFGFLLDSPRADSGPTSGAGGGAIFAHHLSGVVPPVSVGNDSGSQLGFLMLQDDVHASSGLSSDIFR